MEEFPSSLLAFEQRFGTEVACVEYLRSVRWPDGFRCPACGGAKSWVIKDRRVDECAACGKQTSITAGTVFHGTRKPLTMWFRAMAQVLGSKQGCSALELERLLGVAHQTAWHWAHKLRELMRPVKTPLYGHVEVDESYFGGEDHENHGGRTLEGNKTLVIAAVEVKTDAKGKQFMGRARVGVVPDATTKSLVGFVEGNVASGSVVRTDGWHPYRALPRKGYKHHREVVGDKKLASKMFPNVHRLFSLVKRVLLATHQGAVQPKHLQAYLDEYVFRFNRRSSINRYGLVRTLLARAFVRVRTYRDLAAQALEQPLPAAT